jgi:hypothetical protein
MKSPTLSPARTAIVAVLATLLVPVASTQAGHSRFVAHTKRNAERNVVRVAPHSWNHRRIAALIDADTGLLRNNVRTICHGRGRRYSGRRYRRFVCVLRPWPATGQLQLFVSYRALPHNRFRVHLLRLQRRK